jgi:hypothetical protein
MAEGNIHANGPIKTGRKGEDVDAYERNYERIFGKKAAKNREEDVPKKRGYKVRINGELV